MGRAVHRHGYLATSGLPTLYADYAQNVTVEGDNYLLTQQTARFLLKAYEKGRQVRPSHTDTCACRHREMRGGG
jgi:acyl-CoA oxidase